MAFEISSQIPPAQLPDCLQRPDLGGNVRTRTRKTIERCRYHYNLLSDRAAKFFEIEQSPLVSTSGYVATCAPDLSHSTYRQYAAAVLNHAREQFLKNLADENAVCLVVDLLDNGKHQYIKNRDTKEVVSAFKDNVNSGCTNSGKARYITEFQRDSNIRLAAAKHTRAGVQLAIIFIYGEELGLRPWEWPTAKMEGNSIFVQCAKATNGRGIAPVRELILAPRCSGLSHMDFLLLNLGVLWIL